MTDHFWDPYPVNPEHALAVLDCTMQLGDVLRLIEDYEFPAATPQHHKTLVAAYKALLALTPEAEHDERLDPPFSTEED